MSSYIDIYIHIVFSVKNRMPSISEEWERDLYKYIYSILLENKCYVYRIGGYSDHIHILTSHPYLITLPDLMRKLKANSSRNIREKHDKEFEGWQDNYFASGVEKQNIEKIRQYIIYQKEHHKKLSFLDEIKAIFNFPDKNDNP